MKIKKTAGDEIKDAELMVPIVGHEIRAVVIWQDKNHIGLRYKHEFNTVKLVKKITKRVKEPEFHPRKIISDSDIAAFRKKDILSSLINLMAELENPDTDITKLQLYVEEISKVCRETGDNKGKWPEESEEIRGPENLEEKLKKTGMSESQIIVFLNERINEANHILKGLGLHGKINSASLPQSSFKIEGYFPRNIHFRYFLQSLKDFNLMNSINRMAIRYEDEAYTHFILNKFMIAGDLGFKSKAYCVIPCQNISHDELYLEDFSFFDLVIFKDIDSLPISHMREFIKLWNRFDGKMIVTFSNYSFLDSDSKDLYLLLKSHIVDFPSYFLNNGAYEKMIDHTINYLHPYMSGKVINKSSYLTDFFSMNYIKLNELQSYV